MSAGIPFGFGAMPIPNADPDEYRRILRQAPFDPSQAPPTIQAGDRTGPAGAQIHHPGSFKPGMSALAMDEAETQRLEQAATMQPAGQAARYPGLADLFGGAPMGPAQSFSGTSGTIVPGPDAGLQGSPLPPTRPSAADLAAPAPLSFGRPPQRATAPSPQADAPAPGAVPAMGQAPAGLTAPAATSPSQAAAAPNASTPAPEGPSFLDKLMGGIRKTDGLLTSIGAGLMSTPGFGAGVAAGLKSHEAGAGQRAASKLAGAEQALKVRKLQQEDLGTNLTYQRLVEKGVPAADAQAAIAASRAGHNEALSNLLNNNFRKVPDAPSGFVANPDGTMRVIPGGPADPATKRADAQATSEGSNAGKPAEGFNLSEGQTRYNADGTPMVSAAPKKPDGFDVETKLRGEFAKGLGTFSDVHDGYGRIIAATRQREANPAAVSPASDMSLVFSFMKMLDPTSVVRETEYATAKNATGVPDQVRNAYNKALNGEFLTDAQRNDFLGQATELYGTARKNADTIAGRYRNLAGQYGVDPERTAFLPPAPEAPRIAPSRSPPPASGPLDVGASRDAGGGVTIRRVR